MALLDEIGAVLSTQSVASSSGVGGWLLVLSFMPDSTAIQDKVVAIIETPGFPPDAGTDLDRPGFQVRVRGDPISTTTTSYAEARQKIEDVKTTLHALASTSYSGRHYPGVWAEQEPFLLRYDQNDRPELAINFRAMRSRTT